MSFNSLFLSYLWSIGFATVTVAPIQRSSLLQTHRPCLLLSLFFNPPIFLAKLFHAKFVRLGKVFVKSRSCPKSICGVIFRFCSIWSVPTVLRSSSIYKPTLVVGALHNFPLCAFFISPHTNRSPRSPSQLPATRSSQNPSNWILPLSLYARREDRVSSSRLDLSTLNSNNNNQPSNYQLRSTVLHFGNLLELKNNSHSVFNFDLLSSAFLLSSQEQTTTNFSTAGTLYIFEKSSMTGHSSYGASENENKSKDAADDISTFNAENLQNNMKVIYYSRTFLSIIGGVIAGILGFTGLTGFVFYFLVMAITSLGLVAKTKFSVHAYFDCWNRVVLDGFLGGLMSFVLFWTFAYDLVHIF